MQRMICLFVLSFLLLSNSNAQVSELPHLPWHALSEDQRFGINPRWVRDVEIKLRGNYTTSDSIMVEEAMALLNPLLEIIQIRWSQYDRGNVELIFVDSTTISHYSSIVPFIDETGTYYSYTYSYVDSLSKRQVFDIGLDLSKVADSSRTTFVTNQLAWALYPRYLNLSYKENSEWVYPSTFYSSMRQTGESRWLQPLTEFDKEVLRAVYAADYPEKLALAKEQFNRPFLPSWLSDYSHGLLIWPLVLFLFLFTGVFILLYKRYFKRIKHPWLRLNAVGIPALLVLGFLLSLFFGLGYELNKFNYGGFTWLSVGIGVLITLMLGLPTLNVLYLVEVFVAKRSTHKFVRSLLLFLSLSLLPASALFGIVYFTGGDQWKNQGSLIVVLVTWLTFTIVGVLRALVSFYLLKEKELKKENELQLSRLRELKTKAELNALHSKINPHFLYNALNSIAGLARMDLGKTEQMALSLSKLFRYSINREQSDWSTLGEELAMVQIYLDIEKIRFEDRLDYIVDLSTDLMHERVPRFLVQPLVENAIKHGVASKADGACIKVKVSREEGFVVVAVADNGPAFPDDLVPGFGLQGIYDKLNILYQGRFELHFSSTPEKQVVVKLLALEK